MTQGEIRVIHDFRQMQAAVAKQPHLHVGFERWMYLRTRDSGLATTMVGVA